MNIFSKYGQYCLGLSGVISHAAGLYFRVLGPCDKASVELESEVTCCSLVPRTRACRRWLLLGESSFQRYWEKLGFSLEISVSLGTTQFLKS